MDSEILETLIAGGESLTVELKAAPPRPAELAERICGMANGAGGYLIVGVEDKTLEIVGVSSVADTVDILLRAARLCKPVVAFNPAEPWSLKIKGKTLVVARIERNGGQLYQAGGVFWKRTGTNTIPLLRDEVETFLYTSGAISWEKRPLVNATLEDLDREGLEKYVTYKASRGTDLRRLGDLAAILTNLGCATTSLNEQGTKVVCPTNAGMLLFGKYPQDYIMQARIECVLFADTIGLRRYKDRRDIRGPIFSQIDQAQEFLTRHMPISARVEGFSRIDEPEYPLEALREAVVNAVVHRDYSLTGEVIRLFYYPDRIEIHSPGLLLPGIYLEDLQEGRTFSKARNPFILNGLKDFEGKYIEALGTGIRFMIEIMRDYHHPTPEFVERGEFLVTFRNASAGSEAIAPISETPTEALPLGELTQEERQRRALEYVQKYGSIANKEYRALTGVSESTAMRDLETLVEKGSLKMTGKKRTRRYSL